MGKIITIANRKGGTGKTTSTIVFAEILADMGKSVLVIDTDAQANLTDTLRGTTKGNNILQIMLGMAKPGDCIQHLGVCDLIAADIRLNEDGLKSFIAADNKETALKIALEEIKNDYDFILIDTPPNTDSIMNVNVFACCDYVIITTSADAFGIDSMVDMFAVIDKNKANNDKLSVLGVALTNYKANTNVGKKISAKMEELAKQHNTILFNTRIRPCINVVEAQALRQPLIEFAPRCNATKDYKELVDEVLKRIDELK